MSGSDKLIYCGIDLVLAILWRTVSSAPLDDLKETLYSTLDCCKLQGLSVSKVL